MAEIPALTAIRGVAALWVLGFHIPTSFPGTSHVGGLIYRYGYTGVDLFFTLSGLILIIVHPDLRWRNSKDFFLKRIFRIYPLHVVVTLALALSLVLCSLAGLNVVDDNHYSWVGLPFSLLLIKPYFPSLPGDWNQATWSLGVELFCYCTLPALCPLLKRFSRGVLLLIVLLSVTVITVWFTITGREVPHAGLGALMRGFLEFYMGCCLGLMMSKTAPRAKYADIWGFSAIIMILLACIFELPALIPACSAVLISALYMNTGFLVHLLSLRPLVWLGRISFSVYILHLPMFTFLNKVLPRMWPSMGSSTSHLIRDLSITAFVLILSHFSYLYIERPGQRLIRHFGSRTRQSQSISVLHRAG